MVNPKQEREIEEHMRKIKKAKNENRGEKEIKRRAAELYAYLVKEGLVSP